MSADFATDEEEPLPQRRGEGISLTTTLVDLKQADGCEANLSLAGGMISHSRAVSDC